MANTDLPGITHDNSRENDMDFNALPSDPLTATLRTMVRTTYDLQELRIQVGNRIAAAFRFKLGLGGKEGKTEKELEKEEKGILDRLRKDYAQITNGIIEEGDRLIDSKIPTERKFQGVGLITEYGELLMVDQYLGIYASEKKHFSSYEKVLNKFPLYEVWLKDVDGVGPAMAGVLLSEIDIRRAKYSSSIHRLAGLDVVEYGVIVKNGKEIIIPGYEVDKYFALNPDAGEMVVDGEIVQLRREGRSKKAQSLVLREYLDKKGDTQTKLSITFNPFLKTKLAGVLATSFLRATKSLVDGKKCGGPKRLEMAIKEGFDEKSVAKEDKNDAVIEFLKNKGHDVVVEPCYFAKVYYGYKKRLRNMPDHDEKTDAHIHRMALRYMVKIFLNYYYEQGRAVAGLPIYQHYHEEKLGIFHEAQDRYFGGEDMAA